MRDKLPKSFYFKIIFIILVFTFVYNNHSTFIHATLDNPSLSAAESFTAIFKEVMDLPQRETSQQIAYYNPKAVPANQEPYQLEEEVKYYENYQIAADKATAFNNAFQAEQLNEAFLKRINYMRNMKGWDPVIVGHHLAEGTAARAQELGQYHYLSAYTAEGQDFRAKFPQLPNAGYRLGENLYELFISAGDIHLKTWENSGILADYLYEIFEESISMSNYDIYHSQYIYVHAEPTDYLVDSTPYVRIVVSLVMDIEE